MLDDRDYMRFDNSPRRQYRGCIVGPSAVVVLLIVNIAVFIMQSMTKYEIPLNGQIYTSDRITDSFSLISGMVVGNKEFYRVFTYMFLHGGIGHIFFNMWGLYLFGSILERKMGSSKFYALYFISGLTGALLWILFNRLSPGTCIGASGAVFGIMLATALFFPDMQIMLLIPPIPMKMKTFAIAYGVIEILFELSKTQIGIAHIVHLGGFLGGYIYIKAIYGRQVWGISSLFKRPAKHPLYDVKNNIFFTGPSKVSQNELDRLLDKISVHGVNSLSEEEMDTLRRAREQMNGCTGEK